MPKSKRSWNQRLISFLIFAAVLVLTHGIWLPVFGTALLVPDRIQKADCIVVLRGEEYFRIGKAAELYKEGLAQALVTSVIPKTFQSFDMTQLMSGYDQYSETEMTLKIFEYFGIAPEAILLTGKEVTSTYEEAVAARAVLQQKGFRSLLLVTSTYHMARALLLFRGVFHGTGIEIYPVTAPHKLYEPERWWMRERDVRRVAEEYVSLVFNWFYHFILKKNSTAFDTV